MHWRYENHQIYLKSAHAYLLADKVNIHIILKVLIQLDNVRMVLHTRRGIKESMSLDQFYWLSLTSCCKIFTSVWKRSQFRIFDRGITLIARFYPFSLCTATLTSP